MQHARVKAPPDEEIRSFRAGLRVLEREMARRLGAETTCCGVTVAQCHCLLEVDGREEPTVGDLAEALDVDGSTMSRNIDGVVAAGFVERVVNPKDRRSVIVRLSGRGRGVVEDINRRNDVFHEELLAGMSAQEKSAVMRGIRILARRLRELREAEEV